MQQQEKASGFAIQLSSNLLSSKAASLRGRPVFPCLLCVPTTWCANDGAVDSTTSTTVIESTATSRFSCILLLKHVNASYAREHGPAEWTGIPFAPSNETGTGGNGTCGNGNHRRWQWHKRAKQQQTQAHRRSCRPRCWAASSQRSLYRYAPEPRR